MATGVCPAVKLAWKDVLLSVVFEQHLLTPLWSRTLGRSLPHPLGEYSWLSCDCVDFAQSFLVLT